ncbi:class I SAM-dependent methyltransferase [Chitinophagaceae bacterium MMS25-I14]
MKDLQNLFSETSENYAAFRPKSPGALFDFVYSQVHTFERAWDCGTGNGQVAAVLADRFQSVCATDISEQQLAHAVQKDNITYGCTRSEDTEFPDNYFDLITIAQAIHWFDFDAFFAEAVRVGKPGSVLAAWTYNILSSEPEIDEIIHDFYSNIVGAYWPAERHYIDEEYRTIPFPLEEIPAPVFFKEEQWTMRQLTGYLETWSSVQIYKQKNGTDPMIFILDRLAEVWPPDSIKTMRFPIYARIGRIVK